jgi:hypothetical protein
MRDEATGRGEERCRGASSSPPPFRLLASHLERHMVATTLPSPRVARGWGRVVGSAITPRGRPRGLKLWGRARKG